MSIEGAIDHERKNGKKARKKDACLSLPHINYLTRLLTLTAGMKAKNRSLYESVKSILIFPYESIISQQSYLYISKSVPSIEKIKDSICRVLVLHKHCQVEKKPCFHL